MPPSKPIPPSELNVPLSKPNTSLRKRKMELRKRSMPPSKLSVRNLPPCKRCVPFSKRNMPSGKPFNDVAGDNSNSVTGFIMAQGFPDVHIQNMNVGNQDGQEWPDPPIRERCDDLGITLTEQSQAPCDIYAKLLLPIKHGYPLWLQDPDPGLSPAYRSAGVNIGDVGTITYDGGFDFFFNICYAADHPINCFGVPGGFVPLTVEPKDVFKRPEMHDKGTHISSAPISKALLKEEEYDGAPARFCGGFKFDCSGPKGAVLVLPEGGSRVDLRNKGQFFEYAAQNGMSWYQFVNGPLGRRVQNGSLCLVTGCDKNPAWGAAAYSDPFGDTEVSLKFMALGPQKDDTSLSYKWEDYGYATVRSGRQRVASSGERRACPTFNQCAFVRGFRISVPPQSILMPLSIAVKVEDGINLLNKGIDGITSTMPGSTGDSSAQPLFPGSFRYGQQHSDWKMNGTDEYNVSFEHISDVSDPYHPLVSINNYLLETAEGSKIAITHDDDWHALLRESDSEIPADAELIRRLSMEKTKRDGDAVYLEFDEVESVPLGPANVLDSIDISDGERESMITSDNNFVQPACGYGHQANSSRLHITQSTEDEGVCLYDTHHKGIRDPRATERDQSSHSKPGSTTSVDNYNPILTQSATDSVNVDVPSPHLALAERAMNVTKAMLFPNTHDTDIQDDLLRVENRQRAELGIIRLRNEISGGASHDSSERYPPPKCYPGTRASVLDCISRWIESPTEKNSILRLSGSAGVGKTAIAQTVAEQTERRELAASFFFSCDRSDCNTIGKLWATVACQIAMSMATLRPSIGSAVMDTPGIVIESAQNQLQKLVIEPFRSIHSQSADLPLPQCLPFVVILDALDECESEEEQVEIIRSIATITITGRLPLRFFITSRPEPRIRQSFDDLRDDCCHIHLDSDGSCEPVNDIQLFLQSEFDKIYDKYPDAMSSIPKPWPQDDVVRLLAARSSGLFIYAATALKFVNEGLSPTDQLEIVLDASRPLHLTAFKELDTLFSHILSTSPNISVLLRTLGCILVLRTPLSPNDIDTLLSLQPGDTRVIFHRLHSLVHVPNSPDSEIRPYHVSLGDFIFDQNRSGDYHVDRCTCHLAVAHFCLQFVKLHSRQFEARKDMMPFGMKRLWSYAITHWVIHLINAEPLDGLILELMALDDSAWSVLLSGSSDAQLFLKRVGHVVGLLKNLAPPPRDLIDKLNAMEQFPPHRPSTARWAIPPSPESHLPRMFLDGTLSQGVDLDSTHSLSAMSPLMPQPGPMIYLGPDYGSLFSESRAVYFSVTQSTALSPPSSVYGVKDPSNLSVHEVLRDDLVPHINYDLQHSDVRSCPQLTPNVLAEPASIPAMSHIVITCDRLPWKITITPSRDNSFVTVGDILDRLDRELRQGLDMPNEDYGRLPHETRSMSRNAFEAPCQLFPPGAEQDREHGKGKCIDYLNMNTRFLGFVHIGGDSDMIYWKLKVAGPDRQSVGRGGRVNQLVIV